FGMPASALASTVLSLETLLGTRAGELVDRLDAGCTWTDRFAVLDDVLTRQLMEPRPIREEVIFGWHQLLTTGGAATVASLATAVGWSRRHFTDQFRAEFGLPPKAVAKVVRFERARNRLLRPDRPSLARVAAESGYADQAHLARDWRELAGSSPSAWLETEVFPFVQDAPVVEEAF
ncbi:MAG: helix-turn-helix domain-containing protein, partial [Acidimicrobiia bacterium]